LISIDKRYIKTQYQDEHQVDEERTSIEQMKKASTFCMMMKLSAPNFANV
jgi:hypothetical protein